MKELLEKWGKKGSSHVTSLKKKVMVIRIDPDKFRERLKRTEIFFGYIFLSCLVLFIASVSFHGKANITNFYPSNCLGGWENPTYAEGIPDVRDNFLINDFSPENSAVLNNASGQLFCGNFKGEVPEDSLPKKFVLRISMTSVELALPSKPPFPMPEEETEADQNALSTSDEINSIIEDLPFPTINEDGEIIEDSSEIISEEDFTETIFDFEDSEIIIDPEIISEPEPQLEPETKPQPEADSPLAEEPQSEPDNSPSEESSDGPVSYFLKKIFSVAFAQEEETLPEPASTSEFESQPEPELETIPEIQSEPNSETQLEQLPTEETVSVENITENQTNETSSLIEENIETKSEDEMTDAELLDQSITESEQEIISENEMNIDSSATETLNEEKGVPEIEINGDDYFEVSYTLDGTNWKVLGTISKENILNPFFEIPLETISWENIDKLQISINSLPTIDKVPIFYIDGMWIENEYEEIPDAELLQKDVVEDRTLPLRVELRKNEDQTVSAVLINEETKRENILSERIVKKNYYFIYDPIQRLDEKNGGYCAKINGRDWIVHGYELGFYGTCFVNDTGDFEIIETSEDVSGQVGDIRNSEYFISSKIFTIKEITSVE